MTTKPIQTRLAETLRPLTGDHTDQITHLILDVLEEVGLLVPLREKPYLATTTLRVLCDLAQHPSTSLHEVAVRLSITESAATKAMTSLAEAGLVVRTNAGARNRYQFDLQRLISHGDIKAILTAIATVAGNEPITPTDIT